MSQSAPQQPVARWRDGTAPAVADRGGYAR